jgi:hypothetical protein
VQRFVGAGINVNSRDPEGNAALAVALKAKGIKAIRGDPG